MMDVEWIIIVEDRGKNIRIMIFISLSRNVLCKQQECSKIAKESCGQRRMGVCN